MHPTPTCKTTRKVPKQIYHVVYPRVQYSSNDKKQHTYRRRETYIQKKGKINIQKTTLTFTYLIKIGLTFKQSPAELPSVAIGVTMGTANKNNFFILQKQRSRHHSLLGKTIENQKQDKASLRKQISSPGVGYVCFLTYSLLNTCSLQSFNACLRPFSLILTFSRSFPQITSCSHACLTTSM